MSILDYDPYRTQQEDEGKVVSSTIQPPVDLTNYTADEMGSLPAQTDQFTPSAGITDFDINEQPIAQIEETHAYGGQVWWEEFEKANPSKFGRTAMSLAAIFGDENDIARVASAQVPGVYRSKTADGRDIIKINKKNIEIDPDGLGRYEIGKGAIDMALYGRLGGQLEKIDSTKARLATAGAGEGVLSIGKQYLMDYLAGDELDIDWLKVGIDSSTSIFGESIGPFVKRFFTKEGNEAVKVLANEMEDGRKAFETLKILDEMDNGGLGKIELTLAAATADPALREAVDIIKSLPVKKQLVAKMHLAKIAEDKQLHDKLMIALGADALLTPTSISRSNREARNSWNKALKETSKKFKKDAGDIIKQARQDGADSVSIDPVLKFIDKKMPREVAKDDIEAKTLRAIRNAIVTEGAQPRKSYYKTGGYDLTKLSEEFTSDPNILDIGVAHQRLMNLRVKMRDMMGPDGKIDSNVKRLFVEVEDVLEETINKAIPGLKGANTNYRNTIKTIRELEDGVAGKIGGLSDADVDDLGGILFSDKYVLGGLPGKPTQVSESWYNAIKLVEEVNPGLKEKLVKNQLLDMFSKIKPKDGIYTGEKVAKVLSGTPEGGQKRLLLLQEIMPPRFKTQFEYLKAHAEAISNSRIPENSRTATRTSGINELSEKNRSFIKKLTDKSKDITRSSKWMVTRQLFQDNGYINKFVEILASDRSEYIPKLEKIINESGGKVNAKSMLALSKLVGEIGISPFEGHENVSGKGEPGQQQEFYGSPIGLR